MTSETICICSSQTFAAKISAAIAGMGIVSWSCWAPKANDCSERRQSVRIIRSSCSIPTLDLSSGKVYCIARCRIVIVIFPSSIRFLIILIHSHATGPLSRLYSRRQSLYVGCCIQASNLASRRITLYKMIAQAKAGRTENRVQNQKRTPDRRKENAQASQSRGKVTLRSSETHVQQNISTSTFESA